jgi:hypothetical protein
MPFFISSIFIFCRSVIVMEMIIHPKRCMSNKITPERGCYEEKIYPS